MCRCANQSLLEYFRTATGLKDGKLGAVMAIQTFGDYARWHPHIHVPLADGLFRDNGVFHVMPRIDIDPLAKLFRANVLKMLRKEKLIDDVLIWKVDPLLCPKCGGEMNIVRFFTEDEVVRKILGHLKLWEERVSVERPPPVQIPERHYEPIDDGWPGYDEPHVTVN